MCSSDVTSAPHRLRYYRENVRDGQEFPWVWEVDFLGHLMDVDHFHLSQEGITYREGHSEISPDNRAIRPGYARNVVRLRAEDADAAVSAVQSALGVKAGQCSEWHAHRVA